MDWKRERDALIAQTYAFVQSVAAKVPDAAKLEARLPPVTPLQVRPEIAVPRIQAAPEQSAKTMDKTIDETIDKPLEKTPDRAIEPPPSPPRPIVHSDVQDEIQARIASFRAHQERFNRERAEYFSATIARLRAALDEAPSPRARQTKARWD
jgi:LmbE family N-acetylglucosaminyl deacetylase